MVPYSSVNRVGTLSMKTIQNICVQNVYNAIQNAMFNIVGLQKHKQKFILNCASCGNL